MLDLRYVLEHTDEVRAALLRRGPEAAGALDAIESLGRERKAAIHEAELLQRERNAESDAMAAIADKKGEAFAARREKLRALGDRIKQLEVRQKAAQTAVEDTLLSVPNVPDEQIPTGRGSEQNREVRAWGEPPKFDFAPLDHADLGASLGILDSAAGTKIAGARFAVLRGQGARLERALLSFMLDLHTAEHGYTEIWPPAIVKAAALRGTGQLPKFEGDVFKLQAHGFEEGEGRAVEHYLSPTAEVQLTNLHADEVLSPGGLPIRYTAYTPCFRSEAGSYGKDTRGLIRLHQFDKVELVQFVAREDGPAALEQLTGHAEAVLRRLGLHYRVMELCTGDLGFASHRTYDLEVWLPGQGAYREISSCSWFGEYQARRARIRHKRSQADKPEFVHTLNGSGLAVGRALVAVLEQYQMADGSVRVPEALIPYMGGVDTLRRPG